MQIVCFKILLISHSAPGKEILYYYLVSSENALFENGFNNPVKLQVQTQLSFPMVYFDFPRLLHDFLSVCVESLRLRQPEEMLKIFQTF